MPSKLSNLGHSSSLSKVGKYIEIERKIFLMASKEKLWNRIKLIICILEFLFLEILIN
jgi:hypothetical protein